MVARAMSITKLNVEFKNNDVEKFLAGFRDADNSADYFRNGIAACLKAGIFSGKSGDLIAPKDYTTRAEAAVIIRRLLQKSNLI